jgi:hypothetical protein
MIMIRLFKASVLAVIAASAFTSAAYADNGPTPTPDVIYPSAGCTPSASAPTLLSGEIIAHGAINCSVGTSYTYQVCSQAWHYYPRGGGYWSDWSCSSKLTASGSRNVSETGPCWTGGINHIYRSEVHLWFPGFSEQTAYSGNAGYTC